VNAAWDRPAHGILIDVDLDAKEIARLARIKRGRDNALARIAAGACSKCAKRAAREGMKTCGTCEPVPSAKSRAPELGGLRLISDPRADRVRLPLIQRRRADCVNAWECEDEWIAAHVGHNGIVAQARCPVVCNGYERRGRQVL